MAVQTRSFRPKPRTRIRESRGDLILMVGIYTMLTLFFLAVLYPLVFVVSGSFSDPAAVQAGKVILLPVKPTLLAYKTILAYKRVWVGFGNSLYYTVVGTLVNVVVTLLAAYPLSRKDLAGRNLLMFLFVFTTLFSGGLIPTYLVVKSLGLLDTRWAMIIPQALAVWNLLIAVTYIRTAIPGELLEAAQLDGASDFRYFISIVLPLSTPLIAVLALFYAVGHWNSFFTALIYLSNRNLHPLQLVLREILVQNQVDQTMMMSMDVAAAAAREGSRQLLKYVLIVVASVPVLVIYPFAQKYFVRGMMIGALKG